MKELFKKNVSIFMALFLTINLISVSNVNAKNSMTIDMSVSKDSELRAGDIIDLNIIFSGSSKAVGGNIDLKYDADYFEVVKQGNKVYTRGSIIPDGITMMGNDDTSVSTVKIAYASADTEITESGIFSTIKFKVKSNIYGSPEFKFTRAIAADINVDPIDVTAGPAKKVSVPNHLQSISLNPSNVSLIKGDTQKLLVTYNPDNTTDKKDVSWSTSDASIASVSVDGTVTAVKTGNATITAKVGNKIATSTINVTNPINSISFEKTEYNIVKNQELSLKVITDPIDADTNTISWDSSDKSVATVSNGVITPLKEGNTTITAQSGGKSATTTVNVKEIHIDNITVTPNDSEILKDTKVQLNAKISPVDTTDEVTITWKSSEPAIATIDDKGEVTGIKEGAVTITAQAGTKTATATIKVKEIHIDRIELNATTAEILKGENVELIASVKPDNTTDSNKNIIWESSDPTIATVKDGIVTGIKEGNVTITAKNGLIKSEATIIVKEIHINGIQIDKSEISLLINNSSKLNATLLPKNTTDTIEKISWSSSDESIATVDDDGNVKGIKEGNAIISAQYKEFVAITKLAVKEIHIDEVVMNTTSANLFRGESFQLTASYRPDNTTDNTITTWSTSDNTIASVDGNGNVRALKEGNVFITATIANKEVKCAIQVVEKHLTDERVQLSKSLVTIKENEPFDLNSMLKIDTTDKYTIEYKISNEDIARIVDNKMIAVSNGNTTLSIIISGEYGNSVTKTVNITSVMNSKENTDNESNDVSTGPNTGIEAENTIALLFSAFLVSGAILFILKKKKDLNNRFN